MHTQQRRVVEVQRDLRPEERCVPPFEHHRVAAMGRSCLNRLRMKGGPKCPEEILARADVSETDKRLLELLDIERRVVSELPVPIDRGQTLRHVGNFGIRHNQFDETRLRHDQDVGASRAKLARQPGRPRSGGIGQECNGSREVVRPPSSVYHSKVIVTSRKAGAKAPTRSAF